MRRRTRRKSVVRADCRAIQRERLNFSAPQQALFQINRSNAGIAAEN
jgi:hypothetical protein